MSGFVYFWRTYTTTVSGSITRREQCVGCSRVFDYVIARVASGRGDSPYYLTNAVARARAEERARVNLNRKLRDSVEPVYCPTCGTYQPDMVQELYHRFGQTFDPNKYAMERIEIPYRDAWRTAQANNTVAAYEHFMEVWPTTTMLAQHRIKELKRPLLLRTFYKLLPKMLWAIWAAIVCLLAVLVLESIIHR
jgi:hypothetical protein